MISFLVFLSVITGCAAVCLTMWNLFRTRVKDSLGLLGQGFPRVSLHQLRLAMGIHTLILMLLLSATFVFLW